MRLNMRKTLILIVVTIFINSNLFSKDKLYNLGVGISTKNNFLKKDIYFSDNNFQFLKISNSIDMGFWLQSNFYLSKKKTFFLGVNTGFLNDRYNIDFKPNLQKLGYEGYYDTYIFNQKYNLLSLRSTILWGYTFYLKKKSVFTVAVGFNIDNSLEKKKYNAEYYTTKYNGSIVYKSIYPSINLGSNSQPDISEFVEIKLPNLSFKKKIDVGLRYSNKLCNCNKQPNKVDVFYYDENLQGYENSFTNQKSAFLLFVSYNF